MHYVSLTRLRLRSVLFLPFFAIHASGTLKQTRQAPGFLNGALLQDRRWTFWTMTVWDREESMRAYMLSGSHRKAMPHLQNWCDEASVTHWLQADQTLVDWMEADARMRSTGRPSKVKRPGPHHASLTFEMPRITRSGAIRPA